MEASVDGDAVALGPRQRRMVLAVLAWEVNHLVPVQQLVELVWPDSRPRAAEHAIRVHVSALRGLLAAVKSKATVETRGPGYLLRADPMDIDVHRFRDLVRQAGQSKNDEECVALLEGGLRLWRGPALADTAPEHTRQRLCAAAEESRLAAIEDRNDILLRLGRINLVDELIPLVDVHPTRERLVGQLMLALYRGGQASRSLEVLHRTKEYLAEELGIDPGGDLRRLELAILRNDPGLDPPRVGNERVGRTAGPVLVGRRHELARLAEWRARALSGGPAVMLVEGVAGIGKTTLLAEFGRITERGGTLTLFGSGVAEQGAPAYWPWRQVFRQWLAVTEPTVAARALGDAADRIDRIVPEIRRHARSGNPVDQPPAGAQERFALFDHVAGFVARMAVAAGGLVVVLDDLHWADPASLLLFSHLAHGVVDAPLLLVGAFRPYDLRQAPRGGETLAELTRLASTGRMELVGLSTDEVAEQLTSELGRPCDPDEVTTVARRTGGNPLFVREIGRLRRADPKAPITDVPEGARDTIRQHLNVLSLSCRAMLTTASALSVDIDPVLVAAVSGSPIEDVLNALDESVATSVVLGAGRAGFRFAHDLVRDCLTLDLPPGDRARIHLRAAEHFERTARKSHLAQIAHHRLTALPLGDPAAATRAAAQAAELAMTQLAYEDAARLYDQALSAEAVLDAAACGELLIGKATAQYLAYDIEPARRTCEAAAKLAQREGDAVGLGHAALVMPDQMDPAWLATVKPWCRRALTELPRLDSVLRAKLLAQQVTIDAAAGAMAEAARTSDAALAMAERLDDPAALVAALRARQHAHSGPDGNIERLALGDRMIHLARRVGDTAALWGYLWRFDAFMQTGRVREAELQLDLLEPVVDQLGQSLGRWHLLRSRAAVHMGRGQFAEALESLDHAAFLAERGHNPHGVAASRITRAFIGAMTSHRVDDTIKDVVSRGLRSPGIARLAMASLCIGFEEVDRARELYREIPPLEALPTPAWVQLIVHGQYAEVAAAVGDIATAESAYRRLRVHAGLHVTAGAGVPLTGGSVQRCLGLAAAACGHTDVAIDHFRAAVTANTKAGLAPHAAFASYHLAVLLDRRGGTSDHAEAVTNARTANSTASRLGMPRLHAHAAKLLSVMNDG